MFICFKYFFKKKMLSNYIYETGSCLFCTFQVAPAELEELLLSHPDINDAAVIP